MPGVIRAIDLLLLPLTNVINFLISDENKSTLFMLFSIFATFYFDPLCPLKGACTFMHRLIKFKLHRHVTN
jgi:hypothetical protein